MRRSQWDILIGGGVIFAASFLAYAPALRGGFVWDDEIAVVANPLLRADDGLRRLWLTTESWDYWPLTYSTFWIERRLWEFDTLPYHILNVALHALGATLVWRALRRLHVPGAWMAALLFALHPVNAEAVAWIVQRKTVLSGALGFGSLLCLLRHENNGRRFDYAAALLLFAASLLSKASTVTLPVAMLVLLGWRHGRIARGAILRVAPFFLVSAVLGAVNVWFQANRAIGSDLVRNDGFLSRLAAAGWAMGFYLYKAVLPIGLAPLYPRWNVEAHSWAAWLPLAAVLAALGVGWTRRHSWGLGPLVALAWFAVMLMPVLGFVDIYFMRFSLVADHWQYLALPAVPALLVGVVGHFAQRSPRRARIAWGAGLCAAGLFAVLTWREAHAFQSEQAFWTNALARNPASALAAANLGRALSAEGRHEAAVRVLREGLQRHPDDNGIRQHLGIVLLALGDVPGAAHQFRRILETAPDDALAHAHLAIAHSRLGDVAEAEHHFRRAMELAPRLAEARHGLAVLLQQRGEHAAAAALYREALAIVPDDVSALNNLALLLAASPEDSVRDGPAARALAERAARQTSYRDPRVLNTLAAAFAECGDFEAAAALARRAAALARAVQAHDLAAACEERAATYGTRRPWRLSK